MSLSLAFQTAKAGLATNAAQTALISQNINNVNTPNYARRSAEIALLPFHGSENLTTERAANAALYAANLAATSQAAGAGAQSAALDQLASTLFDASSETSLTALVGGVADALHASATQPSNRTLMGAAVTAAGDLARGLNDATTAVQGARSRADADIAASVGRLTSALADFEKLNTAIVAGTRSGADALDAMDDRDAALGKIAAEIGVRVVRRADNDIALFTEGGQTLFDTRARAVSFQPSNLLSATTSGHTLAIDGVPVSAGDANQSGALMGALAVRDAIAPRMQAQLDELARGLIGAFAETDQSGGGAPPATGLFAWSGSPALPIAPTSGLAGDIRIAASVDPAAGGDVARLRDGGVAGPDDPRYVVNAVHAASFSDRLDALASGLSTPRAFDPAAGLGASATLLDYAGAALGDFAATRQNATAVSDRQALVAQRAQTALSNSVGVNLDSEMSDLLRFERSYQASARVLAAADELLQSLLQTVR